MSALRQKMQDRMVLRGFSIRTHQAYISWIEQLAPFHRISPDRLTDDQQLLGHKQISTTLHYVHWLPRYKEQPGEVTDLLSDWRGSPCPVR